MKNQIKLNSEISIDIPRLIEGGMVILANSGGGKSYAIRKIAEEAVNQVQTIILDPEGEFSSLREKYDFILAGKNADVPVETRSAALLAIKLLELGKSAVVDLYELHPSDRQRFVKLFCDAMVNCPKELYHPVLIILDEAHEYVPEGKPSEATWAVESLASKGRKRGQRLILASQRISKLSKNASAECNNKLIGRASQDIDMKRAGDELGFNKEKLVELRQLKPGEFFAFGPAISDEVIKLKIGEVKTQHAKVGYKNSAKVPPPSHVIKKVLGELKDLPQEAEKEAKTISEFKAQVKDLKTKLAKQPQKIVENDPKVIEKAVLENNKQWEGQMKTLEKRIEEFVKIFNKIKQIIPDFMGTSGMLDVSFKATPEIDPNKFYGKSIVDIEKPKSQPIFHTTNVPLDRTKINISDGTLAEEKQLGKCPKAIYSYLHGKDGKATKTQIAVATGYSRNSGGFNNSIYELSGQGLIEKQGEYYSVTQFNNRPDLIVPVDTSLEKWTLKLGACPRKIYALLLLFKGDIHTKEFIATNTGYSATSGGFNNSIYELSGLGLIEKTAGGYRINPEILEI